MPERFFFLPRGVKLAALSCNDVASHKVPCCEDTDVCVEFGVYRQDPHRTGIIQGWIADIEATKYSKGKKVTYPIIADADRELAIKFGMVGLACGRARAAPLMIAVHDCPCRRWSAFGD